MRTALCIPFVATAVALAAPFDPAEAGGIAIHHRLCDEAPGSGASGIGEGR